MVIKSEVEDNEFSLFDLHFKYTSVVETTDEWVLVHKNEAGDVTDVDSEALVFQSWVKTGNKVTHKYVDTVDFIEGGEAYPVEVCTTPSGPLMGIVVYEDADIITLMDPAVINYDGTTVKFHAVFGVARRMDISKKAIITRLAPVEILLGSYPGFVIQNRMFKYQLRPVTPLAQTSELDASADADVAVSTR